MSLYDVALADVVVISENPEPLVVERYTLKPVSSLELSVHAKLICDVEAAVALNPEGADGASAPAGDCC